VGSESASPQGPRTVAPLPAAGSRGLVTQLKRWLGPLYRQKAWIERLQYLPRPITAGQQGHDLVREQIARGRVAVGKIGESELRGLVCYLRNRDSNGHCERWDSRSQRLYTNAGVFPTTA